MSRLRIALLLLLSFASFEVVGQDFFRRLNEVSLTEEPKRLKAMIEKSKGDERKVLQIFYNYFHYNQELYPQLNDLEVNSRSLQLGILSLQAHDHRHNSRYAEALSICDSVIRKSEDPYVRAEFYRFSGVTYSIWGDFPRALEDLQRAKDLFRKERSEIGEIVTNYYIINAYLSAGRYKEFEEKLDDVRNRLGDRISQYPYPQGNYNTLFASKAFLNDDYTEAMSYTSRNIHLYQSLKDTAEISRSAFNTALVCGYLGYNDSLIYYLRISKNYEVGTAHPNSRLKVLISLMEFLSKEEFRSEVLRLYGFSSMEDYFETIEPNPSLNEGTELKLHFLKQQAKYYEESGNSTLLLKVLKEQVELLDGIIEKDTINSELIRYKLDLEQARTKALEYENSLAQSKKRKLEDKLRIRNYITYGLSTIILLIIAMVIIRIRALRRTQEAIYQKKLEELKNKNLQTELEQIRGELSSFREQLVEKTKLIDTISENINVPDSEKSGNYEQMSGMKILTDEDWERFKSLFSGAHPSLTITLQKNNIDLTDGELRMLMLLKLRFTRKEMGNILGIGSESIRKSIYRLKKKIEPNDLDLILMEIT